MNDAAIAPWLLQAARMRVSEFAAHLRSASDGSQKVPNLDWTISELGAHVACLPSFWSTQHDGGDHFDMPPDFAAYSDQQRAHITETSPAALAQIIDDEGHAYLDRLDAGDVDCWIYGRRTTPANMCGSMIEECVLHGRDLAGATGAEPPVLTRSEALAIVDAMMVITPGFIDPGKAADQPDGVYHVRFRGGQDFTWTKSGQSLTITEGRPAKADAHLIADPVAFVMTSLGRMSDVRAALTAKMIVYGRRPWRFIGLGGLAVDGV